MNWFPPSTPFIRLSLIALAAGLLVSAGSSRAASNDKRALSKFNGTYKGAWNAAGSLPLTLRMPKGKGNGQGGFDATPCAAGNDNSPLKIRITKYKVRRNGKKLISTGKATWERTKVAALKGQNLSGTLKVIAVLRGNKASAGGSMATGTLAGALNLKINGSLPAAACVDRAFALSGSPVDGNIPDNTRTVFRMVVPNSVAVISDLDVAISIAGANGLAPFNSDYDVTLRHVSSGTEIELFTDVGFGDDGIFVLLDDAATVGIETVADDPDDFPITGIFKPEAPATLAEFNGVLAGGVWELDILDDNAGLAGTLLNWTLHIK